MGSSIISSVRPTPEVCGVGEDSEEEGDIEVEGTEGERLKLEGEEDVIKMINDPLLPSEAEVEKHILAGHNPYRNWCDICVQSQGKEMPHRGDQRRRIISS